MRHPPTANYRSSAERAATPSPDLGPAPLTAKPEPTEWAPGQRHNMCAQPPLYARSTAESVVQRPRQADAVSEVAVANLLS